MVHFITLRGYKTEGFSCTDFSAEIVECAKVARWHWCNASDFMTVFDNKMMLIPHMMINKCVKFCTEIVSHLLKKLLKNHSGGGYFFMLLHSVHCLRLSFDSTGSVTWLSLLIPGVLYQDL